MDSHSGSSRVLGHSFPAFKNELRARSVRQRGRFAGLSSPFSSNPLHPRRLLLPIISALRRILESMIIGSALFSWASLPALRPASARACGTVIALSAAIESGLRKIMEEKIWDVSPNFRHLTPLESIKLSRDVRQNAQNCVAFSPNNPFVFNESLMLFVPCDHTFLSA